MTMDHPLIIALTGRLGPDVVVCGDDATRAWTEEPRRRWHGRPLAVVRPSDSHQVQIAITLCREHGIAIVPRGGGTGTVGGASVSGQAAEIVLSLDRMRNIDNIDAAAATLTAEAGVTLEAARQAAAEHDLDVPLSLASGGSATIGGIIATNAGGNTTIRHGNARRMALGLEAVLADGQVLDLLSGLRKDNTGYALGQLLIGSEGTLGIVTRATLALVARPRQRMTVWCALRSPAAAIELLQYCRAHLGETLTAFELVPRRALELVLAHVPDARDPFDAAHPWYALIEADSAMVGNWLEAACTELFGRALQTGQLDDAVIATSRAQARALWQLREAISPAQKHIGASIKHDIAVPVAAIPRMIEETLEILEREIPGIRPCVFGHVGDGNLHFNLSRPTDWSDGAFMAEEARVNRIVFDQVQRLRGSIAAEHGIGRLRVAELVRRTDPVRLDVMRRIKRALDPDNLLNPGKVVVVD